MYEISIANTGVIYRNPKPHVRSVQAYFPSLVDLGGGEMLCSIVLGQAFESADCRVHLARSRDWGQSWTLEGRMMEFTDSSDICESCRIAMLSDGSIMGVIFRYDRHRKDEGLCNPENLGLVETSIHICRSLDNGRTWSLPTQIEPPVVGPSFEQCSPVVELTGGELMLPTSTWRGWNGECPLGMRAVAFVSSDGGSTWPRCVDVMNGTGQGIIYWEQKIAELSPKRLIAVAWTYDEPNAQDLHNSYSLSIDGECTFSAPKCTDLYGQTPCIVPVDDETLLCIYRRMDRPGLWAAVVSVADGIWTTKSQLHLWGNNGQTGNSQSSNIAQDFATLKFGAPSAARLADGSVLVAFWCVEELVSNIRWIRLECK